MFLVTGVRESVGTRARCGFLQVGNRMEAGGKVTLVTPVTSAGSVGSVWRKGAGIGATGKEWSRETGGTEHNLLGEKRKWGGVIMRMLQEEVIHGKGATRKGPEEREKRGGGGGWKWVVERDGRGEAEVRSQMWWTLHEFVTERESERGKRGWRQGARPPCDLCTRPRAARDSEGPGTARRGQAANTSS